MKVLFIAFDAYQGKTTGCYPPLHLCNLATTLSLAGHEVKIIDHYKTYNEFHEIVEKAKEYKPDLIGMTLYTLFLKPVFQLCNMLKSWLPNIPIVLGGAHATAWPAWTLENYPQCDFALQGECDRTIVHFVNALENSDNMSEISGIVYRKEDEIHVNPKALLIEDINDLPIPNRRFLDENYQKGVYWDLAAKNPLDIMITSRGCPYVCNFCFKLEQKYRLRSVENVLLEFEDLKRRGIKTVHIQDDAFTANRKRCIEILDALIKSKMRLKIKVRSRVNSITPEILEKAKKAGINRIIYGLESGSQKILDLMNKRTTVEMNRKAIEMTKKAGIACYGEIMIGMPGETRETLEETKHFLLETKPIIGWVPVLYPLPRTRVYEEAKKEGTLIGDWSINGNHPWVKLDWTNSYQDLYKESAKISKTIQRDPGTVWYFIRSHVLSLNVKQVLYISKLVKINFLDRINSSYRMFRKFFF